MAKKVFLQDLDEKLLPITRGELVLDSSGKEAFHSTEFLASTALPGLMSKEDKIRLSLLSSIPIIEGNESDEYGHWTGLSSDITEYYDGLTIIYIPFVAGTVENTYLKLNQLDETKINILENNSEVIEPYTILGLVFNNGSWNTTDFNDTLGSQNNIWICNPANSTKIIATGTYALTAPSYVPIIFPSDNTLLDALSIQFEGTSQTYYPIYINSIISSESNYGIPKGFYLAYFDGEKVYINTNGVLPGIIEKAKIAETVEWNIVTEEGTNPDLDDFSTTVDNASYLTIHNLGSAERAPETYKPQAVTAWINQEDMPTQSPYSGLNMASVDPITLTSWLLCSNASEVNNGARLWFRAGIATDWNSWQQVAFANDLLTRGMGINLSAGDDLNSLDTGIYYSADSSISEQLTNSPTSESGFKLIALAGYEAPNVYGALLAYSDTNFFWRLKQDNTDNLDWYSWIKFKQGEAVGSPTTPMYIDETGTLRAINCSIQASVPSNALFTDTRCTSLSMPLKPEAETISDESEVVGVLKADSISASGDGTYLSGNLNWVNVPTENFVKKTFKVKQTYVGSPNTTGAATEFIDTITQDTNGKINATKKYIPKASSWLLGLVQVGDNLKTDSNGVLSALGYTYLDDGSFIEGNITEYYAEDYSHIEGLHLDLGLDLDGNALTFTLYKVPFDDVSMKFSETISLVLGLIGLDSDTLQTNLYIAHSDYDELSDLILTPNDFSNLAGLMYSSGYGELIHVSSGSSYTGMMFYLNSTGLDSQPQVYPFVITLSPITDSYLGNTFHFHTTHSVALIASHSEGVSGSATLLGHSEGMGSMSSCVSHAEGKSTLALSFSHSEGMNTHSDYISHAEGFGSSAVNISHAEGTLTLALNGSHAEGYGTVSSGKSSHAEGFCTKTNNLGEHAQGKFNLSNYDPDDGDPAYQTISSIGIGTSDTDRKNAVEVMDNGDMYVYGLGNYDGTNPTSANTLQTVINNLNGSSGTGGAIPVATDTVLGGIKLGYTESGADLAVKLDNEKAHVTLSKSAIVSALGFEPGTGSGSGEGSGISITPGIGLTGTTDDSAITSSGTINLKQADSSELGGIKIGYTQNDKNYPVVLDTDGNAYVNVPYPDAKYCNEAVLKTADFPAYNSTEITAIDSLAGASLEAYFKALCKYVYAKYQNEEASNAAITLLGQARPGATGTLLMSMYTNNPSTNDPTMPKYVSGSFVSLSGLSFIFSNLDYLWTWKQLGSGSGTVTSITPGDGLLNTDDTKTSITSSGVLKVKIASTSEIGGVKTGFTTNDEGRQYKLDVNDTGHAYTHVPWTDTKNTAGSNDTTEDLYIIGAQELGDNPQTYSHSEVKISGNAVKASGGFYQESDERLKDFHDDILVDLEQLSNLPKKKFTWKSDDKKEFNIGTSAQELQKLYPELVKEDSNGTLSVAYDKLSIIALKAIDELYQRNIELERRIKELENK